VLAESGLPAALSAAARRSTMPTTVDAGYLGRYPAEVEATVYFCCLEAIQNASKHAWEGATLTLRLREDAGMLTFDVVDDRKGSMPRAAGWAPDSSTWPIDWALSEAACGWNRLRSEALRCRGRSRRRRALTPGKGHQRHAKYQPVISRVLFTGTDL
jgi:hypothetical protein